MPLALPASFRSSIGASYAAAVRGAVARTLENRGADQRNGFGIVQLHPAIPPSFRQQRGGEQQQLVFFPRR